METPHQAIWLKSMGGRGRPARRVPGTVLRYTSRGTYAMFQPDDWTEAPHRASNRKGVRATVCVATTRLLPETPHESPHSL